LRLKKHLKPEWRGREGGREGGSEREREREREREKVMFRWFLMPRNLAERFRGKVSVRVCGVAPVHSDSKFTALSN
jgi:hypothetical protein